MYHVKLFIEPLYRRGGELLSGGYKMIPWISGRLVPGAGTQNRMRDGLMRWFAAGNTCSVKEFSIKWRVVSARHNLYVYIVPETIVTDENDIIDCCICIQMDVYERGSHSEDFFIEWFVNALSDDFFGGQLPEESLTEMLIEDRLHRSSML